MVLVDEDHLMLRCRAFRNLCFDKERRFIHEELGWNFRMSNLQAAVGVAQLERIEATLARKRQIGMRYRELLDGHPLLRLPVARTDYADNIYWVFGVVLEKQVGFDAREAISRLRARGVDCRHFFWPLNDQPIFRKMGLFGGQRCPNAEYVGAYGFYLPSGAGTTREEVEASAYALKEILV
jgi:perosamine synthetase